MSEKKEEPDHRNFTYHPRDIDQWGAIKGCVCKACKAKREDHK